MLDRLLRRLGKGTTPGGRDGGVAHGGATPGEVAGDGADRGAFGWGAAGPVEVAAQDYPARRLAFRLPRVGEVPVLAEALAGRSVVEARAQLWIRSDLDVWARHLGDSWPTLAPLAWGVTKALQQPGQLVRTAPVRERADLAASLLRYLVERGVLREGRRDGTGRCLLRAAPEAAGLLPAFGGRWLERYTALALARSLTRRGAPHHLWTGVSLTLADGTELELDVVTLVGGRLLWLECASRPERLGRQVYRRELAARRLGLQPSTRAAVVAWGGETTAAEALAATAGVTIIPLGHLKTTLELWLDSALADGAWR